MQRGDYLVHAVMHCMGCHSKQDDKANPPVLAAKEGSGQVLFEEGGFRLVAPNITSDPETGIGKWSDDAIARAIREGIAADGTALFPIMPYEHFRDLSDEDLSSIVVFLRSVPPAHSDLPPNKIPFLFARLIQAVPKPVIEPVPEPDRSTPAKYGAYLVKMATCSDCHTPLNPKFQPIPGLAMAGGNPMEEGRKLRQHYAGRVRHRLLRRGTIRPDHAHRLGSRPQAEFGHALVGLSQHDGR